MKKNIISIINKYFVNAEKINLLPPRKKNSMDITYDNHSIVQSDEIIQPYIQSDNIGIYIYGLYGFSFLYTIHL